MDTPETPFKSFEEEAEYLCAPERAGESDGFNVSIRDDHVNNPSIAAHEAVHERIFSSTADGHLLSALLRLRRSLAGQDPQMKSQISSLLENSKIAHEVAATFIGVKEPSHEKSKRAFLDLPKPYKNYYRKYSDVIDFYFKSSRLQTIIAWSITHHVFSSLNITLFASSITLEKALDQLENPDCRIEKALLCLDQARILEIAKLVEETLRQRFGEADFAVWNGPDEKCWDAAGKAGVDAEAAISNAVGRYLESETGLQVLTLDQWKESQDNLQKLLGSNIVQFVDSATVISKLGDPSVSHRSIIEAWWQSGSRIVNTRELPIFLPVKETQDGRKIWKSAEFFSVISPLPKSEPYLWSLYSWLPGEFASAVPPLGLQAKSDVILPWLSAGREFERANEKIAILRSLIIGIRNTEDFIKRYDDIVKYVMTQTADGMFGRLSNSLSYYWTENWIDALLELSELCSTLKLDPPESMTIFPERKIDTLKDFVNEDMDTFLSMGPILVTLRIPAIPGLFMRSLNPRAFAWVSVIERSLASRGAIVIREEADCPSDAVLARESFNTITNVWDKY